MTPQFDYYSFSFPTCDLDQLLTHFDSTPIYAVEPGPARLGYAQGYQIVDQTGELFCSIYTGGLSQRDRSLCFASGDAAVGFVPYIRSIYPVHDVVRADVKFDFDEPGAWEALHGLGVKCSRALSLSTRYIGPSLQETADVADAGRTLYVGSRSSSSMVRIYEKGIQQGALLDSSISTNWVRLELECKPQNPEARSLYASASALDIFTASRTGKYLAKQLSVAVGDTLPSPSPKSSKTNHEKAIAWLRYQYRKTLYHELSLNGGCYLSLAQKLLDDPE